ncbi:MAG: ATP synthase gamma chain [Candidatus Dependentiae bacterium ADurb.Bin331]|nr:MAG: ATP synthase gamma chain [Candidatus Dependentiae bacterium ADurb.Bin331]
MSELIQMRQRMKAIETIKKVTHAMRLISMSSHARLRSKRGLLEHYQSELIRMIKTIQATQHDWHYPLQPNLDATRDLAIVIGSQKGLCGNFNNALIAFFARSTEQNDPHNLDTIVIGKKAVDLLTKKQGSLLMEFKAFTINTLAGIARKITDYVLAEGNRYRSITIYYQYPKTFFAQRPSLYNLTQSVSDGSQQEQLEPYRWEHDPKELLDALVKKQIEITFHETLLNSLIAEQSARFIAMDSSTRNASTMLDEMRINYNKLRQAKITRELTDLVGSFF